MKDRTRRASCSCARLTVRCRGEPLSVSLCNCQACQRRTGSAFGVAAFFPTASVRLDGDSTVFVRTSDEGREVTFHFCPACGSTVYWFPERKPGIIAVALGAFADPAFPAPGQSVHDEHKHPWYTLAMPS